LNFRHVGFKLRRAVANHGIMGAAAAVARRIKDRHSPSSGPAKQTTHVHPFDAEFGTDTGGVIWAEELRDRNRKASVHNTGYYATAPSLFKQALSGLEIDFERFTFVDLGAGKGRVLLLASNYPFQQVIGVEFVPELQAVATENISRYHPASRQCQQVQCVLSDVRDYEYPEGPLVVFMWHPFTGPVFERVIANLEKSLEQDPREVYLVYLKPDFEHVLAASQWLSKIREDEFEMSEQDYAAFRFSKRSDGCVIYRGIDKR
jgi:hypothetical protein